MKPKELLKQAKIKIAEYQAEFERYQEETDEGYANILALREMLADLSIDAFDEEMDNYGKYLKNPLWYQERLLLIRKDLLRIAETLSIEHKKSSFLLPITSRLWDAGLKCSTLASDIAYYLVDIQEDAD